MSRVLLLALAVILAGCTHHDLKPPCTHPAALLGLSSCGPLHPVH